MNFEGLRLFAKAVEASFPVQEVKKFNVASARVLTSAERGVLIEMNLRRFFLQIDSSGLKQYDRIYLHILAIQFNNELSPNKFFWSKEKHLDNQPAHFIEIFGLKDKLFLEDYFSPRIKRNYQ